MNAKRFSAETRLAAFPPEERAKVLTMRPEIREMMYALLADGYDNDMAFNAAVHHLRQGEVNLEEALVMALEWSIRQRQQTMKQLQEAWAHSTIPQHKFIGRKEDFI